MKFFIGTVDISSRIRDLTREFNRRGISTLTANRNRHYRYTSNVDYVFSDSYSYSFKGVRPKRLQSKLRTLCAKTFGIQAQLLRRVINECDASIFLWQSILDDRSDYQLLRAAGHKIVTCFVGDDVRWRPAAAIEFHEAGIPIPPQFESLKSLKQKITYVRQAEKYSNLIFSRPDQSQLLTRPYHRMLPYVTPCDFTPKVNQRKHPLIIHPCSSDPIKGVDTVQAAIMQLRSCGLKFEYRRVTGVSQKETRRLMNEADIVIDQMHLPGGGKVSVEAMMSGAVAMSNMAYSSYTPLYSEPPPIVDVNTVTLKDQLHSLIVDQPRRQRLAKLGPEFVEEFANISTFVDRILDQLESASESKEAHFHPSFLQKHFLSLPTDAQETFQPENLPPTLPRAA